ncbi:MAG TPA: murein biosynthesis integral membrane protein MurJ [Vicinamibacterales bacterium]|nr:murein biosynthesis integral membrane protein MurJ [Vicinamibacterales bacterium]
MSSRVARSAGLIGIATLGSRVLGVAREVVLAALFGAGTAMDAFNVAFRVPNLLRDLFAEGAMTAAFVPTFTRTLTAKGREAAWRLGSLVINALLLVTGTLVVLGIVFAGPITQAIASGDEFAAVPGKLELTTLLTRIMLPFLTTIAVAVAMMGMLNSLNRFFVPALSPAMFNVATIFCAFAVVPFMPAVGLPPIAGIALATLLGGLGQIALQWPLLRREGFRYRPILDFSDPELREILRLMGPGTLGVAAVQINVFVNTMLATGEPEGAVSWLSYAFRLMYLPIGLFGVSIATASLPEISRHAAIADRAAMRRTISSGLRLMLMLNVPATIGLIALAHPIVSFLLERGRFTAADTAATAAALVFYAPGLLGYSAVKIASPSFYSLGDSRTPVMISVLSVATNLVLNLTLVQVLGYRGLALGTALAAILNAGTLLVLLSRRLDGLEAEPVAIAFLKILAASTAMGIAAWLTASWLSPVLPPARVVWMSVDVWTGTRLAAAIAAGVLALVGAARLLRIEEFDEAAARVLRRLGRRSSA